MFTVLNTVPDILYLLTTMYSAFSKKLFNHLLLERILFQDSLLLRCLYRTFFHLIDLYAILH